MFLSAGFLLLGQHKVPLARQINSYGVELVLSDVDTGEPCFLLGPGSAMLGRC